MNTTLAASRADMNTDKTVFGFWVYLMTDCVLFASLFAVYAVMHGNTAAGPGGRELFDLPYVLLETAILLTSSFTCGLMMIGRQVNRRKLVLAGLAMTALLGAVFVGLEFHEFRQLVIEGNGWRQSGFLSSYFTLVATHGLHICIGLLWAVVLGLYVVKRGLSDVVRKRLLLFSLFWHFLDVVWIFIFTVVYLYGSIGI